ncbi:cytochrome P450 4V2-like [Bradysia coprophila]|uniref:cytochrome P450 4V2-like n=1 Tax=Bradysia coprophila TaxID=38358 RepID=UPI00187DBB59|nr:cytochrome P450 4V2-like [Bradysia coprophila]
MSVIHSLFTPTTVVLLIWLGINFLRKRRSNSMFAKIPQPFGRLPPVLGHVLLLLKKGVHITQSSFEGFNNYADKFNEYGLFGFALPIQPTVHIFAPEYVEKLMKSTTHINKSSGYYSLVPWLGSGILLSSGEKWYKDRKMMSPAFDYKIIQQFIPIMNKHSLILCNRIETTLNYQIENSLSVLSACALDTICETSMGVDFQTQISGDNTYSTSIVEFNKLAVQRSLNPLLSSELLYTLTPNGRKSRIMIKNMHEFTEQIIAKRKRTLSMSDDPVNKKQMSLLELLLDIHERGDGLSLKEIQYQLDTFVFGGHDTVSNTVAFCLVCLANYTDIQQRLRAEINQTIDHKSIDITAEHLACLPYLDMIIKETLRMYTPIPFTGRQLNEDCNFGEYTVPKGTDVWVNYFALHRNPKYWIEPEKFHPERFSTENSAGRHTFAYVPFSAGLRNCIGQRYAKLFMKIVISQIVREFEIIPGTKPDDLELAFEITIKTSKPILLKFKPLQSE